MIDQGYSGNLFAIEQSQQFCNYLIKQFKNKITLYHNDVSACSFDHTVDAILWLWSGLSEHPKNQQLAILKHITRWLKPTGFMVIETISPDIKAKNVYTLGQFYVAYSKYGTAYGYTPREEEVCTYANALKFKDMQSIFYKTTTGRDRVLYLLKNRAA